MKQQMAYLPDKMVPIDNKEDIRTLAIDFEEIIPTLGHTPILNNLNETYPSTKLNNFAMGMTAALSED